MKKGRRLKNLVTLFCLLTLLLPSIATVELDILHAESNQSVVKSIVSQVDQTLFNKTDKEVSSMDSIVKATDEVTIIVELKEQSLLEKQGKLTWNTNKISSNQTQLVKLKSEHEKMKSKIESSILAKSKVEGKSIRNIEKMLTYGYDYYVVMDGFSVKTQYQYLSLIQSLSGVNNAYVAKIYEKEKPQSTEQLETPTSADMVGSQIANIYGFTGKGMAIAVLDTGLDVSHEAFNSYMPQQEKYTKKDIENITNNTTLSAVRTNIDKIYVNEKLPYVYDYADKDFDVSPGAQEGGEHGTHVSGIIAANCDHLKGIAPEAQLMMMKVFSSNSGQTTDDILIAALDDSVKLGADVINMSLGSVCGFSESENQAEVEMYNRIRKAGIYLAVAAGNSYNSAYHNQSESLAFATDPDYGTIGSPSSFEPSMSVASMVDSITKNMPYLQLGEEKIGYIDTSESKDPKLGDLEGTYEYVYCDYGLEDDIQHAGDVKGKIVLISRGSISFNQKILNAYNAGAIAVIIMNNQSGTFYMSIDHYVIPAVSITQNDGEKLRHCLEKKIMVSSNNLDDIVNESGYLLSEYSSWGPTPDLKLKPEITAPGENIYSCVLRNQYRLMSGTSMAAPNIAGQFAILKQYVTQTNPELNTSEVYKLVNALLMSTATPVKDKDGEYYSPRKQGAGLANVADAISAQAYLTVKEEEKPKLELGANTTGTYLLEFTVHNISDKDVVYQIHTVSLLENVKEVLSSQTQKETYFLGTSKDFTGKGIAVSDSEGKEQQTIKVKSNGSTTIKVKITLDQRLKDEIETNCPNGTYVDGFVRLENENGVDLSLPFLAFYGDWEKAPVIDGNKMEHYHMRDSIIYNDVKDKKNLLGQNWLYKLSQGITKVDKSKLAISPTSKNEVASVISVETGLLRNAKKISYTVTNKKTGKVVKKYDYTEIPKSFYYSAIDTITWAEAFMATPPYFDGLDDQESEVEEGIYTFTVRANIDGMDDCKSDEWTFDFAYDKTPAFVESYKIEKEEEDTFVELTIKDNHYLSGFQIFYNDEYALDSNITFEADQDCNGREKVDEQGNHSYTVKVKITSLLATLKEKGIDPKELHISLFDYAFNYGEEKLILDKILPQEVSLSQEKLQLVEGMTEQITATFLPKDVTEKSLIWTSSNPEVATVDEKGKVTACKEGEAIVTVNTMNGLHASCEVIVGKGSGIMVTPTEVTLSQGEEKKLEVWTEREETVLWSSSNNGVVTVDEEGKIKGVASGQAVVTVASRIDSSKKAECNVTVLAKEYPDFVVENGVITQYTGTAGNVVIPDGIKEIGANVFRFHSNLRSVVIPASVEVIGEQAFYNCSEMRTVIFKGDGLVKIGRNAFGSCYKLRAFDMPSTVTSIEEGAFASCTLLKSIKLPKYMNVIPKNLFYHCSSLTEITFPDCVTVISDGAFYATGITTFDIIPSTTTYIGSDAFSFTKIEEVRLPNNVTYVGNSAFYHCENLRKVMTNAKLEKIDEFAFENCPDLEEIYMEEKVTSIGSRAFAECLSLKKIEVKKENKTFSSIDGVLYNYDQTKLIQYPLGKVGRRFLVPNQVKELADKAFMGAYGLEEIVLNNGLVTIGEMSMKDCDSLASIVIPDSVTRLKAYALSNCPKLREVIIGNGIKSIENYTFSDDLILSKITFGEQITTIQNGAFAHCNELNQLTFPDSVRSVGEYAFVQCNGLRRITFGEKLQEVATNTFAYCDHIEGFAVPKENQFYSAVEEVLFDKKEETLINYPKGKMESVYQVPRGTKKIGTGAFEYCDYLNEVILPEGVTQIEPSAFAATHNLKRIELPESLEVIGESAFVNTKLYKLVLPTKVTTIGVFAFSSNDYLSYIDFSRCEKLELSNYIVSGCQALQTVIAGNNIISCANSAISNRENLTIYAPSTSLLSDYAKKNEISFVPCDVFTVIAKGNCSKVTLGETIHFMATSLPYDKTVIYSYRVIEEGKEKEVTITEDEKGELNFTANNVGKYRLYVTAEKENGTKTADSYSFEVVECFSFK